jgi:hypothetical protein
VTVAGGRPPFGRPMPGPGVAPMFVGLELVGHPMPGPGVAPTFVGRELPGHCPGPGTTVGGRDWIVVGGLFPPFPLPFQGFCPAPGTTVGGRD